jgi:phosphoribosylformylglycinamidine cyclo-ligase
VLLSSSDGVGTKLEVAILAGRHNSIGIDLVAMNVNDLITAGASPLFFLDYLAAGKLASIDAESIIAGIAEGCRQSKASLVGGETAEMPGFYPDGHYDLAGFCVGVAEEKDLIDGSAVRAGDVLVGLHSSGLHSNGYSLARKALGVTNRRSLARFRRELGRSLEDELLEPTLVYVRPVLGALSRFRIHAMAHITGGGLTGNLPRVLPEGVSAVVDRDSFPSLPIFELLASKGGVSRAEMDRTFNCGIGYVMVVAASQAKRLVTYLRRARCGASIMGEIIPGKRSVRYRGKR